MLIQKVEKKHAARTTALPFPSPHTHVVSTSVRRRFNVMNVIWTLKRRRVLTLLRLENAFCTGLGIKIA